MGWGVDSWFHGCNFSSGAILEVVLLYFLTDLVGGWGRGGGGG